jgi:hypothetical protein
MTYDMNISKKNIGIKVWRKILESENEVNIFRESKNIFNCFKYYLH